MSVKIINVLKDDSFNDILDLFRKTSASEVILVLPKVGRLFRHEDHFAAFAAEAKQGEKTVSVLTSNPDTAHLARKFGFGVMTSGAGRTAKAPAAKPVPAEPVLATAPPPADDDVMSFDDTADLGDVPITSDETTEQPADEDEADPLRGMHLEDEAGNPVDENEDGETDKPGEEDLTVGEDDASFVAAPQEARPTATLAVAKAPARPPRPSDLDSVRPKVLEPAPAPAQEQPVTVTVDRPAPSPVAQQQADLDYIDAVWRDKNGPATPEAIIMPRPPSRVSRMAGSFTGFLGAGTVSKRVAVALLFAAVIVLGAVIYLMTGSAAVAIVPVSKAVDTQITVQASDTFTSVDTAFSKLPGQLIELTKTADATKAASGTRDVASKARGKITIYNEYSSTPQTLVATTRFQADDGHVFRTLQTITVPGSTVTGGKTVAGTATVDVIADQPGTEYNIGPSHFIILAFKERGDSEKVEKFYGKSDAAMTGGASGPSSVVTQADYDSAVEAATADVRDQIAAALASQGADLVVLGADTPVIASVSSTANPDDAAESVTVTVSGSLSTVAFRKQDLMELIVATLLAKERLTVIPEQLELTYSDLSYKADLGTLVFTVSIQGPGYVPVDTEQIRKDIAGLNSVGVREYFRDREGVQSATVTLNPFWVRKVPTDTRKIDVQILYEAPTESR